MIDIVYLMDIQLCECYSVFVLFRDNAAGVLSTLLKHCWIMKSSANRCAFVRGEYLKILLLLLQWTNCYKMPQLEFEEEPDVNQTLDKVFNQTLDKVSVDNNVQNSLNIADLQCLNDNVNDEMRLLLEFHDPEKLCQTEVRALH